MNENNQDRIEALGPAERIIQTLLTHADHMVHNRPGIVIPDGRTVTGVRWSEVTHKVEDEGKVVYRKDRIGKKTTLTRMGVMHDAEDKYGRKIVEVREGGRVVGRYQRPGLFPEVVAYLYRQVAEVFKVDNDFAARWASYAFGQEHRDLKVILAAFMLVQDRRGDAVRENGEILFHDDDFREVGEAMCLHRRKDKRDLNPKLLLRVGDVLVLPEIAEINRELGFSRSQRNPALGRWPKVVTKWLRYREQNLPMLEGLAKAGFKSTVQKLAQRVGYKPETPRFFRVLRWTQKQAPDGRREIAIGVELEAAETWAGMTEAEVCQTIVDTKPNWKRIVGLLPKNVGITRAVVAASIEAGSLSDADLIIMTPTLEDLGLLDVPAIKARWDAAAKAAENLRAINIAKRVKKAETVEALQDAADHAMKKAVEEVFNDLRAYIIVDKSGSMQRSLAEAKELLATFLQGFPLDRTHVSVFNSAGREITIKHASRAGVEAAFRGHSAGGTTVHASGVRALQHHKPKDNEDTIIIWVGDEGERGINRLVTAIEDSGIRPVAFGMLHVGSPGTIVHDAARHLGIPCFDIDKDTFSDVYAIPRTIRNLIANTPVGEAARGAPARRRLALVDTILNTDLLQKPVWA